MKYFRRLSHSTSSVTISPRKRRKENHLPNLSWYLQISFAHLGYSYSKQKIVYCQQLVIHAKQTDKTTVLRMMIKVHLESLIFYKEMAHWDAPCCEWIVTDLQPHRILGLQTKVRLNLAKFPVLKAHYMLTKSGMYAHWCWSNSKHSRESNEGQYVREELPITPGIIWQLLFIYCTQTPLILS
jgi:hypothetical protein